MENHCPWPRVRCSGPMGLKRSVEGAERARKHLAHLQDPGQSQSPAKIWGYPRVHRKRMGSVGLAFPWTTHISHDLELLKPPGVLGASSRHGRPAVMGGVQALGTFPSSSLFHPYRGSGNPWWPQGAVQGSFSHLRKQTSQNSGAESLPPSLSKDSVFPPVNWK